MSKLVDFLNDVKVNRTAFLQANSGKACEELFRAKLSEFFTDFTNMPEPPDQQILAFKQEIKKTILNKKTTNVVDNTLYSETKNDEYKDFFISQPYSSQDYPDFLVFTEFKVFPIEIKYSAKKAVRPMWNSNLPKMDGIYFFGCRKLKELTFFRGEDILPSNERKSLLKIWKYLKQAEKKWKKEFKDNIKAKKFDNSYGFKPYIRKAYQQTKTKSFNANAITDFFRNADREKLENKVVDFIEKLDK